MQAARQSEHDNQIANDPEGERRNCSKIPARRTDKITFRNVMRYIRLFADATGESHFEDVEIEFAETEYISSSAPLGLSFLSSATQFIFMEAHAGWESDWHPSSARNFFVVVTGEWEVTASDGETQRFREGSLLLVEDTTGKGHKSRVVSDSTALMVQL